ncbi:unnamed protein product, partial [Lymnaea stagnalis]
RGGQGPVAPASREHGNRPRHHIGGQQGGPGPQETGRNRRCHARGLHVRLQVHRNIGRPQPQNRRAGGRDLDPDTPPAPAPGHRPHAPSTDQVQEPDPLPGVVLQQTLQTQRQRIGVLRGNLHEMNEPDPRTIKPEVLKREYTA